MGCTILMLWLGCACASSEPIVAAFWNVENLFDAHDDQDADDDEFTPRSPLHWTEEVYHRKLAQIRSGIALVGKARFPDLLGLAEVERRGVIAALLAREFPLEPVAIVHEQSPGARGIDVALCYRTDRFRELEHGSLRVQGGRTRDILYVRLASADDGDAVLHVLVNHWPARRADAGLRAAAARTCRAQVDRILAQDARADILVLGDFNDEPGDDSVARTLGAGAAAEASAALVNLALAAKQAGEGTIAFAKTWQLFDQVIVSRGLLSAPGFMVSAPGFRIVADPLLRVRADGPPRRFVFRGVVDPGGFSDHLPVRVTLELTPPRAD
ncbi:MAG: endonuclease/exonuclease/phosphatase family protein [Planctomycetota bacterium]